MTVTMPTEATTPAAPSAEEESKITDVMYSWRVTALRNWIEANKCTSMETLCKAGHLDQYHYFGIACNEELLPFFDSKDMNILDIGSGIGGVGRYLSWKTGGCKVYGVDIQEELVKEGNRVTELVGLQDKVVFEAKDCTVDGIFKENEYDAFYSLLVFLHIPKGPRLNGFKNIYASLKDGAHFVIEDYIDFRGELTADDHKNLSDVVGAVYIPTKEEYAQQLKDLGFVDVEFEDLTGEWQVWTKDRRDSFVNSMAEKIKLFGEAHCVNMEKFYNTVANLFASGRLGGARITGSKKTPSEWTKKGRESLKTKPISIEDKLRIAKCL